MNATKFAVTRFKYPNGATSWRVDGRLQGLRIRKNFKTREEAWTGSCARRIGTKVQLDDLLASEKDRLRPNSPFIRSERRREILLSRRSRDRPD